MAPIAVPHLAPFWLRFGSPFGILQALFLALFRDPFRARPEAADGPKTLPCKHFRTGGRPGGAQFGDPFWLRFGLPFGFPFRFPFDIVSVPLLTLFSVENSRSGAEGAGGILRFRGPQKAKFHTLFHLSQTGPELELEPGVILFHLLACSTFSGGRRVR